MCVKSFCQPWIVRGGKKKKICSILHLFYFFFSLSLFYIHRHIFPLIWLYRLFRSLVTNTVIEGEISRHYEYNIQQSIAAWAWSNHFPGENVEFICAMAFCHSDLLLKRKLFSLSLLSLNRNTAKNLCHNQLYSREFSWKRKRNCKSFLIRFFRGQFRLHH